MLTYKPVTLDALGLRFNGARGSVNRLAYAEELCKMADALNSPACPHDGVVPLDGSGLYVAVDDTVRMHDRVTLAYACAESPIGVEYLLVQRDAPHRGLLSACVMLACILNTIAPDLLTDWQRREFLLSCNPMRYVF